MRKRTAVLLVSPLAVAAVVLVAGGATGHGPGGEQAQHVSAGTSAVHAAVAGSDQHAGGSGSGEGHAAATIPPAEPLEPGETRTELGIPGGPYTPVARNGATDDYRCFLLDGLGAARFLTGVRFVPGNPAVVHHAILFRVEPRQVSAAKAKDAADPGVGWSCFGGTGLPDPPGAGPMDGLDSAPWLAAWAPGGREIRMGSDVGVFLPAGTRAVLQVHYNLRGGSGPDDTRVQVRTVPASADRTPLETMLLPAPVELPCPADESDPLCDRTASVFDTVHRYGEGAGRTIAGLQLLCDGDPVNPKAGPTQSCDRRIEEPTTIRAVAGHMHLLGRSLSITLNPGTSGERTLLDIPVWDFDNQGSRPLPEPVRVGRGDVIRVTCTHDAGLRRQLPSLQGLAPRYVTWGEGTTDEMCLGILVVTRP